MHPALTLKRFLQILFFALILGGVSMKRLFDHPELLPPMHIGALLVLIGLSLLAERKPESSDESDTADFEEV
jgi:hypothetical protein